MPQVDVDNLGALMRQVAQAAVAESERKVRVSKILTGTVEDLDENLDVVYVRMDQEAMSGDPTQSNNHGEPGVIAAVRLGETFTGEQVRVGFDGPAGASAMRTSAETRIVLPFGAESGERIVLDGTTGTIAFFDANDILVGFLDATQWFLGVPGQALARLDPLGGLRLRDELDTLRVQLSAPEGLILREAGTGVSGLIAADDGLIVIDPDTGDRISITSGTASAAPTPKWASTVSAADPAGTAHGTPTVSTFGTGDDIDLRFVATSDNSNIGVQSWTPPASYTERSDVSSAGTISLATSSATRDPAITTPGVQNFTSTSGAWSRRNGHSVIIRGGGTTSPAFRSASSGSVIESSATNISFSLALPAGTTAGDMLIAFVAIASANIPVGWTVPPGWKQLGVNVTGIGTPHVLASGIWYKQAGLSEPDPQTVTINMSAAGLTKVHATGIAVSNPYTFPGGLDIRRNNRSMPRGIEAQFVDTTSTGPFSALTNTDMFLLDVAMQAGRTYHFHLHVPAVIYNGSVANAEWQIRLTKDGVAVENFGVIGFPTTGVYRVPVTSTVEYIPTVDEVADWRVQMFEATDGATLQFAGSTTAPRRLHCVDMGATF